MSCKTLGFAALGVMACAGPTVKSTGADASAGAAGSTGGTGATAGAAGLGGGAGAGGSAGAGASAGAGGTDAGVDAAAGGGAGAGGCQPSCTTNLVPESYAVQDFVVSGSELYFGNFTSISKVSTAGGAPALVANGNFRPPLAVDATSVYVFDGGDFHLKKLPKSGGAEVKIADGQGGPAQRLVVTGGYAYFTVYPTALHRVPIAGGVVEKLSTEPFPTHDPLGVAVDATHVFWSNKIGQSISARALSGGAATSIATGLSAPLDVVLDGSNVIFADVTEIRSVPKQGGAVTPLVTGVLPSFMVADATHLYWTSSTAKRVERAPIAGGAIQVIAKEHSTLGRLALDADHVFFADEGGIERAAKDCCVD